ncbi:MAG TPA: hypothetical protein VHL79_13700 [Ramlibacter sp.]|jgi:hypothetical protein|nr:hypothetical protein [Ramlibacter sp.]
MVMTAAVAVSSQALAHGVAPPQHGGVVQSVKDIDYELAPHAQGLMLYVEDHGNPVSMAGVTGKVVLVHGTQRTEVVLRPAGENRLLATGMQLAGGQRATALLTMPSGRPVVIQFPAR